MHVRALVCPARGRSCAPGAALAVAIRSGCTWTANQARRMHPGRGIRRGRCLGIPQGGIAGGFSGFLGGIVFRVCSIEGGFEFRPCGRVCGFVFRVCGIEGGIVFRVRGRGGDVGGFLGFAFASSAGQGEGKGGKHKGGGFVHAGNIAPAPDAVKRRRPALDRVQGNGDPDGVDARIPALDGFADRTAWTIRQRCGEIRSGAVERRSWALTRTWTARVRSGRRKRSRTGAGAHVDGRES